MKMHIELGSSPVEEDCTQTTDPDYESRGRRECLTYINQLIRHYRDNFAHAIRHFPADSGVYLKVKTNHHDFCAYYEVAAYFDDANERAVEAAFWLEANQPTHWDEEAKRDLVA